MVVKENDREGAFNYDIRNFVNITMYPSKTILKIKYKNYSTNKQRKYFKQIALFKTIQWSFSENGVREMSYTYFI
jgi:hypothetical protein